MPENWEKDPSPIARARRAAKSSPRGSHDGRVRQASPPAKKDLSKRPTDLSGDDILTFIAQTFKEADIYTENNTSILNFIEQFGDYITNNYDNSTIVQEFTGDFIENITNYIEQYDNSVTNNFAGNILNEITNFINNYDNSTNSFGDTVNNFLNSIKGAQVFVQPDPPSETATGTLWFDTDELVPEA